MSKMEGYRDEICAIQVVSDVSRSPFLRSSFQHHNNLICNVCPAGAIMSQKRVLENYFSPSSQKKVRTTLENNSPISHIESPNLQLSSHHLTYPFPIPYLPSSISGQLSSSVPACGDGKEMKDAPDLDLLYFHPFIPNDIGRSLFEFLRQELFFYKVQYNIKRGGIETVVNTPR